MLQQFYLNLNTSLNHAYTNWKMFVFNQSKSVLVNKDRFKPCYSCHFYFNKVLPIYSGYIDSPIHVTYKATHFINTTYAKYSVWKTKLKSLNL